MHCFHSKHPALIAVIFPLLGIHLASTSVLRSGNKLLGNSPDFGPNSSNYKNHLMKDPSDGSTSYLFTSLLSCKFGISPALSYLLSAPLCNILGSRYSCSSIFLTKYPWTSNRLVAFHSYESPCSAYNGNAHDQDTSSHSNCEALIQPTCWNSAFKEENGPSGAKPPWLFIPSKFQLALFCMYGAATAIQSTAPLSKYYVDTTIAMQDLVSPTQALGSQRSHLVSSTQALGSQDFHSFQYFNIQDHLASQDYGSSVPLSPGTVNLLPDLPTSSWLLKTPDKSYKTALQTLRLLCPTYNNGTLHSRFMFGTGFSCAMALSSSSQPFELCLCNEEEDVHVSVETYAPALIEPMRTQHYAILNADVQNKSRRSVDFDLQPPMPDSFSPTSKISRAPFESYSASIGSHGDLCPTLMSSCFMETVSCKFYAKLFSPLSSDLLQPTRDLPSSKNLSNWPCSMPKKTELRKFDPDKPSLTMQEKFSVLLDYGSELYQQPEFQEEHERMIQIKNFRVTLCNKKMENILFFISLCCANANDFHENGVLCKQRFGFEVFCYNVLETCKTSSFNANSITSLLKQVLILPFTSPLVSSIKI